MNKEKLKEIISNMIDLRKYFNLDFEDKDLMDFAVRLYNSESINLNKEFHKPFTTFNQSDKSDKPTEKQLKILKANHIGIKEGLTKKEASIVIKELFANLDKKKYGVEY